GRRDSRRPAPAQPSKSLAAVEDRAAHAAVHRRVPPVPAHQLAAPGARPQLPHRASQRGGGGGPFDWRDPHRITGALHRHAGKGEAASRLAEVAEEPGVADEPALFSCPAGAVDLLLGEGDHVVVLFARGRGKRRPFTDDLLPLHALVRRHPHVQTSPAVAAAGHVDRDALPRGALQDQVFDVDRLLLGHAQRGHEPVGVNRTTVTGALADEAVAVAARYALPDLQVAVPATDHHLLAVGDVLPRHVIHACPRRSVDQGSRPVLRDPEGCDAVLHGVDRAAVHAAGADVVVLDLPADPYATGTGDDGVRDTPPIG